MGFLLYGLVMFVSTLPVDPWFDYAYWAFAFCGAMVVTQFVLTGNDPVQAARQLNWVSWLIATLFLVVLMIFARDALFDQGVSSGYDISNQVPTFNGVAMSRSSGLSRLAAVPAIIALVYIFRGRWLSRVIAGMVFSGAFYIIWFMQSRGALFAFLGAFLFTLFLGGRIAHRIGFALCIAVLLFWLAGTQSGGVLEDLWQHATRGTGEEGFQTMSGRPEIWQNAFDAIQQAPFIGYGAQGDRRMLGQMGGENNAQNALIYALLNTGVIGTGFFLLAMLAAWWNLLWLLSIRRGLLQTDQLFVTIAGAMLVFNTFRSIPENNAALFSIDLLLQYPAMVYLAVLARKAKCDLRKLKRPNRQLTPATRRFA
jgi:O-antigen ligase